MQHASQQIPLRIQQLAATHGLGTPRDVHAAPGLLLYRCIGLVCLLIGTLIIIAYLLLFVHVFKWWPLWQAAIIFLVGIAWVCTGVWIILSSFLFPSLRVFVCPAGLIYVWRKAEIIPWSQIEAIWKDVRHDASGKALRTYMVLRADKEIFVFKNDLHEIEELGAVIEREVTRRLLPRALSSYHKFGLIDVDKLVVTSRGIWIREDARGLTWDDIREITFDETEIHIYRRNEEKNSATLHVATIPNVGVLKGLIEHILYEREYGDIASFIALYNAGLPVVFGKLSMSQRGITVNDGKQILLPWSEIVSMSVGISELMIKRKDEEWYALPLWMVSDVSLLRRFVYYIEEQRSTPS